MGHPANANLTPAGTVTAKRVNDLWFRMYIPPYQINQGAPNNYLGNWNFSPYSPDPVVPLQTNSNGIQFTYMSAQRFSPTAFGLSIAQPSNVLIGSRGFNVTTTATMYGDKLFSAAWGGPGGFFQSTLGTMTILPGITSKPNSIPTTYTFDATLMSYPAPGNGIISSSPNLNGSVNNNNILFLNYNGQIIPAVIFFNGAFNSVNHMDFIGSASFLNFMQDYIYGFDNFLYPRNHYTLSYPWITGGLNYFLVCYGASPLLYFVIVDLIKQTGLFWQIALDNAALTAIIQNPTSIGGAETAQLTKYGYLFKPTSANQFGGPTPWSCVLLAPDASKWAFVNFYSEIASVQFDIANGFIDATLDQNGVAYLYNRASSPWYVYNSFALDLVVPPNPQLLAFSGLSPSFVLPGLCGCHPINAGVGLNKGK